MDIFYGINYITFLVVFYGRWVNIGSCIGLAVKTSCEVFFLLQKHGGMGNMK